MSRIGRLPITLPAGVSVSVEAGMVRVSGPRGKLAGRIHPLATVKVAGSTVTVERADDGRTARAIHGLTRKLVANMVTGVSAGFRRVRSGMEQGRVDPLTRILAHLPQRLPIGT